jgi:hypothetical protein
LIQEGNLFQKGYLLVPMWRGEVRLFVLSKGSMATTEKRGGFLSGYEVFCEYPERLGGCEGRTTHPFVT